MSGGFVGQIIVRVLASLVSIATAFTMNAVAPQQSSAPVHTRSNAVTTTAKSSTTAVKPIIQPTPSGVVRQTALQENEYGAHWSEADGLAAFLDGNDNVFVKNAQGVIDVSEHQHEIDWDAVKNSGVDGAIIRISYGWDNGYDKQALRNIRECKRLGIPFGIYMYSYAEKAADGAAEGADVVNLLKGAGVSPSDLTYPVYYDLEKWSWSGHHPPTSPYVYQDIVASWWNQLVSAGYTKLGVYSYTNYLRGPLNSQYIHERTSWVASYGSRVGFPITTALRGWQYTSSGSVNGIAGRVDLNAFGMADGGEINGTSEFGTTTSSSSHATNNTEYAGFDVQQLPLMDLPSGDYFINTMLKSTSSIDIPGASKSDGTTIQLYSWNNSNAQKFAFERQNDGTYVIRNKNSGKVLDVRYAAAANGAVVWQYAANGSQAQRWLIRNAGNGYFIQSALGNWVLDIAGANRANGTRISLYRPNGTKAQLFVPSSTDFAAKNGLLVKSAVNNKVGMDIRWGSLSNSAPLQIYQNNGSQAQRFSFKQVGNGLYTVLNDNSHKAIDVPGAATDNGVKLQQYTANGTDAQTWALWKYADGTYALISMCSGKAIDIPSANAHNGQRVQMYTPNHTAAQRWKIE